MDIRVGNICKFEDFEPIEGRPACFKIGQVTEIKGDIVSFRVLLDIWEGEVYQKSSLVGEVMMSRLPELSDWDWPSRIQILG